jgi:WD40 repeat protein
VFGGDAAISGVLELREFAAGPTGLFPDPQTMAGARTAGPAFAKALFYAWEAAPWRNKGRCVLWNIALSDSSALPPPIDGGSLGAAFALGLRELFRYPARRGLSIAWLRGLFYGIRPRTAVTGVLDGGLRLGAVSEMGSKLEVVKNRRWRLVAPEPNRKDVNEATSPKLVKFAETLQQADKYVRQWRLDRLATLATLTVLVTITSLLVSGHYASINERLQTGSRLTELSGSLLNTNVDLAQLFAVEAYRRNPNPQSRAALFKAVTDSPHLMRSLAADGPVSVTAASTDGHTIVAGTQDGNVIRWLLSNQGKRTLRQPTLRFKGAVTAVATDAHGGTIAAVDHATAEIWSTTPTAGSFQLPSGWQPQAVGVSPSGRFVAVASKSFAVNVPPQLLVFDRTTGRNSQVALPDFPISLNSIAFPDDSQIVAFDGGYGIWTRLAVPDLKRTAGSTVGFGTHDYGSAISSDGRYFTYTNGDSNLPLWATQGEPTIDTPSLVAQTKSGNPQAIALSSDGTRVAQAVANTIYVSRSSAPNGNGGIPVALTAGGPIVSGSLAFVGINGDELISASGNLLNLWNLNQISRIGRGAEAVIPDSCNACSGPRIGLQSNGPGVAVVDGNGASLDVQKFGFDFTDLQPALHPSAKIPLSPPLWGSKSDQIILVDSRDDSARIVASRSGLPIVSTWAAAPNELQLVDGIALLHLTQDGQQVLEVHSSGTIKVRDAATGTVLHQVNGPADLSPTADGQADLPQNYVTVDAQASYAAVLDRSVENSSENIYVTNITTGGVRVINEGETAGIAYQGERLLVQRKSGDLEIWRIDGGSRLGVIPGAADTITGPVTNGGDTVVDITSDGYAQVIDYPSGQLLGALPLPAGNKSNSTGLAFSADSKDLVTATEANGIDASTGDIGELVDWKMDTNAWIRIACDSAGHDLTAAQWSSYMGTPAPSDLRCER